MMRLSPCLLTTILLACGTGGPPPPRVAPPPARQRPEPKVKLVMEPIRLQAVQGPKGTDVQVIDSGTLFERAGQLLSAKKYREAIALYDQLLAGFPASRYVSPALYNAGLCHEWLGAFDKAAKRYQELIRRFGHTKEAVDAGFRLGGCYAELRNWAASAQVFQVLLARQDLGASDRIEAYARKGLAHFRMGDHRAAKSTLAEARAYYKKIETVERLDSDFFLAMAHYYLAAIPHVEFRQIQLKSKANNKELARNLNDKARLLVLSQAGYIQTIKTKNPYWATASGFQIGSLYREFYTALITALPDFTTQARRNARKAGIPVKEARSQLVQVYLEELHRVVKPLLHKAIRVFEKNVEMAERVGVRSNWVGKSRRQVQDLRHLLSLSPREAVKLVEQSRELPEDQVGVEKKSPPQSQPSAPVPAPPTEQADEPGRAVL